MREIEFRGKRKDTGEWVYGDLCHSDHGGIHILPDDIPDDIPDGTFEVDPETVGQYTGLQDKGGVKIFEGDILFVGDGDVGQRVKVFFENGQFVVNHYAINILCSRNLTSEVIGNIHDNPELLEVNHG